jgi:hypothetical protein
LANRVAGAGEPFLVLPQVSQGFGCKKLDGVARWMPEGLEQTRSNQNSDFVRLKSEEPSRLCGIQSGWRHLPTQELSLCDVHIVTTKFNRIRTDGGCLRYTDLLFRPKGYRCPDYGIE